jgi:hypothetical protein
MSRYRPLGLHWRLKDDQVQPETFQFATDPDLQRQQIQLWVSRVGLALSALILAIIFSLTVRGWITQKLEAANDYLGISSPFAPHVNLPRIGLVPRWTVVVSAAVLSSAAGFARRGKPVKYGIATLSLGGWWLLSNSARWLTGFSLVVVYTIGRRVSALRLR